MRQTSRRGFLEYSALALAGVRRGAGAPRGNPLDSIGVELYTVRRLLPKQAGVTLQKLREIGYREAEPNWATLDQIWPDLQKSGLKPVAVHIDSDLFTPENSAKLSAAIAHTKELGIEYAVYPYFPPEKRGGADAFKMLADMLNRAGAECHKAGLRFCYHNHSFEFQPLGATMGMEILLNRIDKTLVGWEMDVFWVSVGGHNPVTLLKQYSGRVPLMHLKDKAKGTPIQYNETLPPTAFKAVGAGVLDFPAILRAASAAGVQHYFVEQDETPGDPIDSLRESYEYLRKIQNSRRA